MKLNKDTKWDLKVGDILVSGSNRYYVTYLYRVGNCMNLTLQDTETKRNIYGCPSSEWYGCEIVKGE